MNEIYKINTVSSNKTICPRCGSSYIGAGIDKTTNTLYSICLDCNYIFYKPIITKYIGSIYNHNKQRNR